MDIKFQKDLLCFSHLRWDFVFQRPQHLMTRFAETGNVYFLEEPILDARDEPYIQFDKKLPGLWRCVPHLPSGLSQTEITAAMRDLLHLFFEDRQVSNFIFWYYTPMALEFSRSFKPYQIVYDCMDELSAFKFAPANITSMEEQLFDAADIVFTGGAALYEAKKDSHANIHAFPSSIDKEHFEKARRMFSEPADQAVIPGLKLGFYGVIDERFDQELIRDIAKKRPEWQLILIGPVVKIDPAGLPQAENIHYLGSKSYQELPAYLSGWNVALIPFLLNESTRFISPTKTPEYLAAGRPTVSTAIGDVVDTYATLGLVSIGQESDTFIAAIEYELGNFTNVNWLNSVDQFLSDKSWQSTFSAMQMLMQSTASQEKVVFVNNYKNADKAI